MLYLLEIHVIEAWMSSVMTESPHHGREDINIFNNRTKLGLAQNNIGHMYNVEGMREVVVGNTLHQAGNPDY
jgi:hypothetical protein